MLVLWLTALAASAWLVLRLGSYGVIAGTVLVWALGLLVHDAGLDLEFLTPASMQHTCLRGTPWLEGIGAGVGAAWTLPFLAVRTWNRRRNRPCPDGSGRSLR